MDRITIKEAKFLCNLGCTEEERKTKQEIIIDLELFTDTKKSAGSKKLEDTIDYVEIHSVMKEVIERDEYILIETLAELIAGQILENFNIKQVLVRLKKPQALKDRNVKYAAVEIVRNDLQN